MTLKVREKGLRQGSIRQTNQRAECAGGPGLRLLALSGALRDGCSASRAGRRMVKEHGKLNGRSLVVDTAEEDTPHYHERDPQNTPKRQGTGKLKGSTAQGHLLRSVASGQVPCAPAPAAMQPSPSPKSCLPGRLIFACQLGSSAASHDRPTRGRLAHRPPPYLGVPSILGLLLSHPCVPLPTLRTSSATEATIVTQA